MKKLPLVLLAAFLGACSVELAPPEKDATFVPLVVKTTQSCDACTKQTCAEYTACQSSDSCVALSACIVSCTTPSCQVDCYNQHQDAYDLYFQLVSCSYQSCSSECAAAACVDCERDACNIEKTACVSDVNCLRDWYCSALCQDDACDSECDGYWEATGGATKFDAYMSCSVSQCASTCQ